MMTLAEKILSIYPELEGTNCFLLSGNIILQDDGNGPYIKEWHYEKPEPTQEQLEALND